MNNEQYYVAYNTDKQLVSSLKAPFASEEEVMKAKLGGYPLKEAREKAKECLRHIDDMCKEYCETHEVITNDFVDNILDWTQEDIMKAAMKKELEIY